MSAKLGEWENVWEILGTPSRPKHANLLNVIPQSRRWCVLHQAVFWNNAEVLQRLLQYKTCDSEVRAKKCLSECGRTDRMTALEIAESYNRTEMATILNELSSETDFDKELPTFWPLEEYDKDLSQSLILVTLSSYKEAFYPNSVDPNRSVFDLLYDIYLDLNGNRNRWKEVRDIVADAVYTVNEAKAMSIGDSESKEEFYFKVVNSYTDEHNSIYSFMNKAFRKREKDGTDLALGPYCVMYQILLLFWKELPRENLRTYRKMMMQQKDTDQYKKNTAFVWPAVVSSARDEARTFAFPTCGQKSGSVEVMFEIDNSEPCDWQPRNIETHATYQETERTYPAGGKFKVTKIRKIDEKKLRIWLKLLPN